MTIWRGHVRRLAEYCDGRLSTAEASRASRHLAHCARCRRDVDAFRVAATVIGRLPVSSPPDSVWRGIDAALARLPHERGVAAISSVRSHPGTVRSHPLAVAAAAIIAALALGASYWYASIARDSGGWQVVRLAGPAAAGRLAVGQTLETNSSSRVRLNVGAIGTVDVEPGTRVTLLSDRSTDQRLALDHGAITATISAPPRLFVVSTPASTVVDLGCQYTMSVDERGVGHLRVTAGWVSLEWGGRASLVPAGASADTRPQVGPGTPSFDDASPEFRDALSAFDSANGGKLDVVLGTARARDTLTLWHLLSRVAEVDRGRVYDRMVQLAPLPSGVTREKALQLDEDTLTRWREELAWTW